MKWWKLYNYMYKLFESVCNSQSLKASSYFLATFELSFKWTIYWQKKSLNLLFTLQEGAFMAKNNKHLITGLNRDG